MLLTAVALVDGVVLAERIGGIGMGIVVIAILFLLPPCCAVIATSGGNASTAPRAIAAEAGVPTVARGIAS